MDAATFSHITYDLEMDMDQAVKCVRAKQLRRMTRYERGRERLEASRETGIQFEAITRSQVNSWAKSKIRAQLSEMREQLLVEHQDSEPFDDIPVGEPEGEGDQFSDFDVQQARELEIEESWDADTEENTSGAPGAAGSAAAEPPTTPSTSQGASGQSVTAVLFDLPLWASAAAIEPDWGSGEEPSSSEEEESERMERWWKRAELPGDVTEFLTSTVEQRRTWARRLPDRPSQPVMWPGEARPDTASSSSEEEES